MNRVVRLLLLLVLFTQNVSAQSVLRLQHITLQDGLSQSSVYSILQDSHGFMWFGTGDGLDRYDGKEFIIYKSRIDDTSSSHLRDRNLNSALFEDKTYRLWMASDAGPSFFDPRLGYSKVVFNRYCSASAMDSTSFWLTMPYAGLLRITLNDLNSHIYPVNDHFQNDTTKACVANSMVVTRDRIWVADNAGLLLFDKNTGKDQRVLVNDRFYCVNMLHDGHLILCSEAGVYLYDTGSKSAEFIPVEKTFAGKKASWFRLAEDVTANCVYIGAGNGGAICRLNLATHKYELLEFQNSSIACLFIDRSQNLWVGTDGDGIYKLDVKQPKFKCYSPGMPFATDRAEGLMIKSIFRDDSGMVWMGSYSKGLLKYDPFLRKEIKVKLSFPTENKLICTIFKDSSARLLVTAGDAIAWLDPRTGRELKQVKLPRCPGLCVYPPDISSLVEWKDHHYLIATNIGLFEYTDIPGNEKLFHVKKLSVWIYNLTNEGNGIVDVGRRDGYSRIRITGDTTINILDEGFKAIATRHFYKSSSAPILWMATEKGLIAYDEATKKYQVFEESAGLANSCIYGILAESDSSLWVSTNKGLSNVRVLYGRDAVSKAQFTNYTSKDGLQSDEFNTGAYYQGKDGTLFFGGIAGINWFRPDAIKPNPYKAIPAIAAIFINDRLTAQDTAAYARAMVLPFDRNTISFSLRALEFTNQEQNQFAYKLEGLDKDWVYTANDKVRYSGVPPGAYTFLLKAANNDHTWNEEPLRLSIIIHPPYWQTWWFRTLIFVIVLFTVFLLARYYTRQKIKEKTRELEKQQVIYLERLRISKDVHDDLGSGLSKISLMAAIAQKKVMGNATLSNDIRHISSVSKELVDNMRDLVWVLNPDNTTLEQLVSRLREYCSDYLENMPLDVQLDFPDQVPPMRISREAQRNIFLTVKEAVNNSIKHADAGGIKILLSLCAGRMNICVVDNGRGFDMGHLKGSGNGLRNMRQRIESIGGHFAVSSAPSASTRIDITISLEKLCAEKIPL
jgi:signal transduction histidine kinase/ligand-binding sensor domain-containing protein